MKYKKKYLTLKTSMLAGGMQKLPVVEVHPPPSTAPPPPPPPPPPPRDESENPPEHCVLGKDKNIINTLREVLGISEGAAYLIHDLKCTGRLTQNITGRIILADDMKGVDWRTFPGARTKKGIEETLRKIGV